MWDAAIIQPCDQGGGMLDARDHRFAMSTLKYKLFNIQQTLLKVKTKILAKAIHFTSDTRLKRAHLVPFSNQTLRIALKNKQTTPF